jgi:hypothetical protein
LINSTIIKTSMKKIHPFLNFGVSALCLFGLMLSSCSQEEIDKLVNQAQNNPPPSPAPSNDVPVPSWSDAHGVLVTTKVKTVNSGVSLDIGVATAVFFAGAGDSAFVEAGTVKVESKELTKQSNNSYTFAPSQTEPTGIAFSNPVSWEVSGNGPVAAFSHDLTGTWPDADSVSSALTFDNNSAYTLSAANVSGADSVIFMVIGSDGKYLLKYLGGNATSCTFTQAEMANIAAGTGLVQVVPLRVTTNTSGTRKYYYVRQTSVSKTVTVND